MHPTDRQDGRDLPNGGRADDRSGPEADARARLDRRAKALRANLGRRKAQSRGRADAERAGPPD